MQVRQTLVSQRNGGGKFYSYGRREVDIMESAITEFDITDIDITESDITETDITRKWKML